MLSRRTVRIKVLQLLYALGRDEVFTGTLAFRQYETNAKKIHHQYIMSLALVLAVAKHAISDYNVRRSKHLPTPEDMQFQYRIWNNPIMQSLHESRELKRLFKETLMPGRIGEDKVFGLYQELVKIPEYMTYATAESTTEEEDKQMVLVLYKMLVSAPLAEEMLEDISIFWEEDKSLVVGAAKKTLKALPDTTEVYEHWNDEDQMTFDFGKDLLKFTLQHEAQLSELIKPKLVNWESDRLAHIDLILIKMALAELLYFPTIPPKVSINEYVELSKLYSTDKSKDFVNGVLDQLMKYCKEQGIMVKVGRGLLD